MNDFSGRSVLITGASSGIGKAIVVHLARQGYTVLAAVRKNSDVETLNNLGFNNLKPVCPLDLTKQEQIHSAANSIKEQVNSNQLPSLYTVINVAGGGQIAPIELMNISNFREELEKRLVGPISLLQELLPLLRRTKGRVLWISTPGLFPVPYVADIHAPDFAVNYLARTLNLELRPDGIKNILVRCGGINTPSSERTENNLSAMFNNWSKEKLDIYRNRLIKVQRDLRQFSVKRTDPEKVAILISKILIADNPRVRYQVGYMSGLGAFLEKLPQSWVDFIMGKREN
ncbi:MAG TPA: SDR family NAD(P)-dependent oxidoreductase [Candidatus Acidoferrales bacterium]|nr:SDR family NAD(P)-dependent oxidoreductase [Candidatus Acidoferrales bacterium]